MKQEVIRDFLNLPGIAGVALMDGRSRPYFCGVDQALNFQQKEALAQGILQVVETIPNGFESFEFQFASHQVYIYKLDHGIILLVLARNDLVYSDYLKTVKQLQATLQEDFANAIATFRLLAGNITLSGLSYRKVGVESSSLGLEAGTTATATSPIPIVVSTNPALQPLQEQPLKEVREQPSVLPPEASGAMPVPEPSVPSDLTSTTLKDILIALNHLSKFTTQYLGTSVIVNYLKATRPEQEWLSHFQVERSAQITLSGPAAQKVNQSLSPEEHQWVRDWVSAFIKRCSQVIRDFPTIVEQKALDDQQKTLLLP